MTEQSPSEAIYRAASAILSEARANPEWPNAKGYEACRILSQVLDHLSWACRYQQDACWTRDKIGVNFATAAAVASSQRIASDLDKQAEASLEMARQLLLTLP